MTTGVHVWSQTASDNSDADSSINFAEGQAPSSVNDSARALMARVAEYRDDNAGSLGTAGSSTAYTVATNTGFTSLSLLDGVSLTVKFDETNGASPTLNVDSLGAKAIHTSTSTPVPAGLLLAGSIWPLTYDNSNNIFVLHGIPAAIGASTGDVKLTLKSTADVGWIMANDGTIGNTSSSASFTGALYKPLYLLIWDEVDNTYAPVTSGRGATAEDDWDAQKSMQLTQMLGRAIGIAGAGGSLSVRTLGQTLGSETHTLTIAEMPSHTHTDGGHSHNVENAAYTGHVQGFVANSGGAYDTPATLGTTTSFADIQSEGGGGAHNNMQPTSFLNAMIKL